MLAASHEADSCGYGGYGGYVWRLRRILLLIIKAIENSLVHTAQGYFIHTFICCDNLLMYRERIKKKKMISIILEKGSSIDTCSFNKRERKHAFVKT